MPIAPLVYVMKGVINTPPYQDVTWRVYGTPDLTGAQSGYSNLINILIDYTITDELAGVSAVPIDEQMFLTGDAEGPSNNNVVAMTGDVTGRTSANTVTKLQNRNVAATAPNDGEALVWVAGGNDWEPTSLNQKNSQIFNSSGTWTAPPNVTKVRAFGYGGGGGGGGGQNGADADVTSSGGGAGGGGAWASLVAVTVVPGTTYTITIGAGGAGGNPSAAGVDGGDTLFGTLYRWKGAGGGSTDGTPGGSRSGIGCTNSLFGVFGTQAFGLNLLGAGGVGGGGGNPGGSDVGENGGDGHGHIAGYFTVTVSGGGAGGAGGNGGLGGAGGGGGGGGASNSGVPGLANGGAGDAGSSHTPVGGSPGDAGGDNSGHGGGGGGGGGSRAFDGGAGGHGGHGGSGRLIIFW